MNSFFLQFTDAHAHLPKSPAEDEHITVPAGKRILLNAVSEDDFPRVAALAKKFPGLIIPAFGIHPWGSDSWTSETSAVLRHYLSSIPFATVGEIGLDRCRGDRRVQEIAFREQLELAVEFRLPVSLHVVRAFGKTEEILRPFFFAGTLPPFLLHAYGGSPEQAKVFARFGGVFSASRKTLPSECRLVPESDKPLGDGYGN